MFPGGYLPALEQVTAAASQQGLKILDIEIMNGHYEEMLKHWRRAFFANIATIRR
ncbi:MAG: class I SAM-dependent methyltransferase, partial [Candidatus Puniceispirillaceae bacterium]